MPSDSPYFICRIETRTDIALPNLRRHVTGKRVDPATAKHPDFCELAHGVARPFTQLAPPARPADMKRLRREAKAAKTGGVQPDPWCEAVFVGPDVIDWHPDRAEQWGRECLAAWQRVMPHSKVVECVLHGREKQWHVHLVAQPRGLNDKGQLRCSRNAMNRTAIELLTGEPPPMGGLRGRKEHGEDCSAIQDEFHRLCGAPFGLRRGERGSEAKHTEIDSEKRMNAAHETLLELKRRYEARVAEIDDLDQERKLATEARAKARRQIATTNRCIEAIDACIAGRVTAPRLQAALRAAKAGERMPADVRQELEAGRGRG